MKKLSFKFAMNFSGSTADDCIEEIQNASTGVKYTPICYGFYSDTNVQPQAIIEEEELPIKDNCVSIKDVIKHLQSITLDSCKSLTFRLDLTSDVDDVIKDEYAIQLPNSAVNISCWIVATETDKDDIKNTLVEIDQIADKILAKYT